MSASSAESATDVYRCSACMDCEYDSVAALNAHFQEKHVVVLASVRETEQRVRSELLAECQKYAASVGVFANDVPTLVRTLSANLATLQLRLQPPPGLRPAVPVSPAPALQPQAASSSASASPAAVTPSVSVDVDALKTIQKRRRQEAKRVNSLKRRLNRPPKEGDPPRIPCPNPNCDYWTMRAGYIQIHLAQCTAEGADQFRPNASAR